jgi:hypothetical protein
VCRYDANEDGFFASSGTCIKKRKVLFDTGSERPDRSKTVTAGQKIIVKRIVLMTSETANGNQPLANPDVEEKTSKPKRNWRRWCCCLPIILILLMIVVVTIVILVEENKQDQKISNRAKPESYSEIFNTNLPPDYTVAATDEEKFNQKIIELLKKYDSGTSNFSEIGENKSPLLTADQAIELAKSDIKFLKDYYPEGYFIVVNSVLKTAEKDQIFPNFYLRSNEENDRIGLVVHELSHIGGFAHKEISKRGYVIDDQFVTLPIESKKLVSDDLQSFLDNPASSGMPTSNELTKFISEPATMDKVYLEKSKQDIYTTLDEIISYAKDTRVTRAYNYSKKGDIDESRPQALSRQLYYLSLQLKNIKENYPEKWQDLKNEKGFSYLLLREVSIAMTEIQASEDEGADKFSGSSDFAFSIDKNLSLFNQNQPLFDELLTATGINTSNNPQTLAKDELIKFGIGFEKF